MKDYLLTLFENSKSLQIEEILTYISASVIIGFVIFASYWLSHSGTVYSKKFNVSLVVLTILTATVMVVIGNNVALSLGMVGALSIVRYRTAIKDSRDTAYIFWAIIAGICCGAGDFIVGAVGSAAVFLVLLLLGRIRNNNRLLLIIRCDREVEQNVQSVVFRKFDRRAVLRVKNSTDTSVELIYEISEKLYKKAQEESHDILSSFYDLKKVQYVNIVAQNDEIL